jgi:hypothetical protein
MIRTIAKGAAYKKAPRTTFTVLHPKTALKLKAYRQEIRRSPVPRMMALAGAALALPLGIALGRMTRRNGHADQHDD